ncbi:MAG: hypothetical protein BGN82_06405 [Alphaproteobacteria bacterium 65-7]|nr:MAG: hypothetical protein BGN82_06405 [Alphaproteobacteria bacterium 65-7]
MNPVLTRNQAVAAAALLIAVQIAALYALGQPFTAPGGVALWEGDLASPRMSQQVSDWYSFSHIIHGFLFYWLLHLATPRLSLPARLLIAMGIEIGWEIVENMPMVIQAYRQQALAAGYAGDSILNSVTDTVMMVLGFWLALRLPVRAVIALALAMELFVCVMIRDNLTLNVLNFVLPTQAVHDWQAERAR